MNAKKINTSHCPRGLLKSNIFMANNSRKCNLIESDFLYFCILKDMRVELKIEGLSCGHCVNAVTTILNEIKGVENAMVSLPDLAFVEFDENAVSLEELKKAINDSEIYKVL